MTDRPSAVLDVGSNTIRLLVARIKEGDLEALHDRSEFVRLGRDVNKTHRLASDRQDAAVAAIHALQDQARQAGATDIVAIATSAVRDATNGPDFVARVARETGIAIEIITGEREAHLTFLGATVDVDLSGGALICDLGGGSAELVYSDRHDVQWAVSLPLGSGRLTELFVHHDPPTEDERIALAAHVRSALEALPPASPASAIFTGGTATHIGILAGKTDARQQLTIGELEQVVALLMSRPSDDIVKQFRVKEERARVLPAGACALHTIAAFYHLVGITITRHGIREGAILDRLRS